MFRSIRHSFRSLALALAACLVALPVTAAPHRVIVFVWDGLRPDAIDPATTPNLAALATRGTRFAQHTSVYPSQTMINAAALATGSYPSGHGFYGNWVWEPRASGANARGEPVDFRQPVFTEDYAILDALDRVAAGRLLHVGTLVEAAVAAGRRVAVVGKTGAVYLQDRHRLGVIVDEKTVFPARVARNMAARGFKLPKLTAIAYPGNGFAASATGDPTRFGAVVRMADGHTPDPTRAADSPYEPSNAYLMHVFLDYVWPVERPDLAILWLRDPDTTSHNYGPGSIPYRAALRAMDAHLGALLAALSPKGRPPEADLIILSDHGHSSVAASSAEFPLRAIADGKVAGVDPRGFSVSGALRTADRLSSAGLAAADGLGPLCVPVLSGIRADGSHAVALARADCPAGAWPRRRVPESWPPGSHPVVVAPNGGTEYYYLPDHDEGTARRLIEYLQAHPEYGALFIDRARYGDQAGTLGLEDIRLAGPEPGRPDIVVSLAYDPTALIQGLPGTEYASAFRSVNRGMHGSLSPRDMDAVLVALGPDFRHGFVSEIPSANVDVAPTVAVLLGMSLPRADGRVLIEGLTAAGRSKPPIRVSESIRRSKRAAIVTRGNGAAGGAAFVQVATVVNIATVRIGARRFEYLRGGYLERTPVKAAGAGGR